MTRPDYEEYAAELDADAQRRREEERRRAWPEMYAGERRKRRRLARVLREWMD